MEKMNSTLDLEEYIEKYKDAKIAEIDNFLDLTSAENIHHFLSTMTENWWSRSIYINTQEYPEVIYKRRFEENIIEINKLNDLAYRSFTNNIFSYSFDRTLNDHYETCVCQLCCFNHFLKSESFMNTVSKIVGESLTEVKEHFASRYTDGCFLSPHHDKNKGKIGFILYLTKNWKPEYGGNLHMMESDQFTVKKTIVPKFNTLVLFDIPNHVGVPHFVSHVSPRVTNKRFAISGWLE
jgi:Rps23 Pro-64 3,4-dihydroxylase Tpa1-like proline 4-hydroxylase